MPANGKTALITGASSGIGYELSKLFAADSYNLVLVARSGRKLNELAAELCQAGKINVTVLAKDLGDPAAPDEIFKMLQAQSVTIDVLINNAGFGTHGPFAENDWPEELSMVQLNVVALTHLTKLFLPGMIERGFGRILNVGSTGSFAPVPLMAAYGATKAYVLSFSEALGEELTGTGVTVTALCPGVTRTGFQARANVENLRMVKGDSMSARQVAKIGYKALMRGQAVVVPGLMNQLMTLAIRITPRSLIRRVSKQMMKPA
jgi:short-subunit dehydrogenase